jgi:hypothetical protein
MLFAAQTVVVSHCERFVASERVCFAWLVGCLTAGFEQGKLRTDYFPFLVGQPSRDAPKHIIVFFVGGAT